jgi:hypothetical protein
LAPKSKVLYSEIALSRKPFGLGHLYIYTFLLRITDIMTSQNIDLSSWDILYMAFHVHFETYLAKYQMLQQNIRKKDVEYN